MHNRLDQTLIINASHCDHTGTLSLPACSELFMDAATLHAEDIGVGMKAMMDKDLFWITAKVMVALQSRPQMMESAELSTWPMRPERVRCDREYLIRQGDRMIARGKTEWAVLNMKTQRIVPPETIFPEGLQYTEPDVFPELFSRFDRNFTEAEEIGTHRIVSTDLDLGGHMNHVAYIRALFGCFSTEALDRQAFSFLEGHYASQSYEGETLHFVRKFDADGSLLVAARNDEGKNVFYAKLR